MIKQDAGMSAYGNPKQKSASKPYPASNPETKTKTTSNPETNTLTTNSHKSKIEERHRWYQSDDE